MLEEYPSPNGLYILYLGCTEMRMSHWVCSPTLKEVATGNVLYEGGSMEDAGSIKWSDDSRELRFHLRTYPGTKPGEDICLRIEDGKAVRVSWMAFLFRADVTQKKSPDVTQKKSA